MTDTQNPQDRKYSDLIPVKHKTAGYAGWVFGITQMKECFTGSKGVPWQYRIWTSTGVKVAPGEDLDRDPCPPKRLPDDLLARFATGAGSPESSELFLLGYQLTNLTEAERVDILLYSAVPALGSVTTVRVLCNIIYRKLKTTTWERYRYAFKEWQSDLDVLLVEPDIRLADFPKDLLQFMVQIKRRLEAGGIKGKVTADDIIKQTSHKTG